VSKTLAVLSSLLKVTVKWPDGPQVAPRIKLFKARQRMFMFTHEQEETLLQAVRNETHREGRDPNIDGDRGEGTGSGPRHQLASQKRFSDRNSFLPENMQQPEDHK
jgi:hypothetical protein